MGLRDFISKQFIDVIQWTETGDGVLAYRYPMQDMEIQYGAQLTVRESQMALFVNEGKAADAFKPGLYTIETRTLPLLTNLRNWDKAFQSPFKSDVYFFSTRLQTNQKWGTPNPITIRDKDFGMIRLRGFGMYSYHMANPLLFHQKVSGTRDLYTVADLDGHLRNTIVGRVSDAFAQSKIPFLDMASNLNALSQALTDAARRALHRPRTRTRLFRRRESVAPGRASAKARRADRDEHRRQPARLHAISGRAVHANGGGESGRRCWSRGWPRCGARDGKDDRRRTQSEYDAARRF